MESTRHTMFLDYYNLLEAAQKAPRAAARACCKSSVKSGEVAAKIGETLDCRRSAQKRTDFFESCLFNIYCPMGGDPDVFNGRKCLAKQRFSNSFAYHNGANFVEWLDSVAASCQFGPIGFCFFSS